jgi:hypothetical protein
MSWLLRTYRGVGFYLLLIVLPRSVAWYEEASRPRVCLARVEEHIAHISDEPARGVGRRKDTAELSQN